MLRPIAGALVLVAVLLAIPSVAVDPVAAGPAECHENPDGSVTCNARTLGCFTRLTVHPDGSTEGWVLAC